MKRRRLIILGAVVIVLVFIYGLINKNFFVSSNNIIAINHNATAPSQHNLPTAKDAPPVPKSSVPADTPVIPNKFLLNVSFTSQAPFGVWDPVHNDACEEAALVMAQHWVDGHLLDATIADKEILGAISWEGKNWGNQYELTAERMATLGQDFFDLKNIKVVLDPTINDIKSELSRGNLVLVPVAGRLLKNPYYRQPGPIYHILVIKGYNDKQFITNDSGTRRGEGYPYSHQTLFNAIHDWPYPGPDFGINIAKDVQAQKIFTGERVMIIIGKS